MSGGKLLKIDENNEEKPKPVLWLRLFSDINQE